MKEDDYRRSDAFIEDYRALCQKHGVQIVSYEVDFDRSVLAAIAFDETQGEEEVQQVVSERKADRLAEQSRIWGIRRASIEILNSRQCTVDELADTLARGCVYYHPMYRDLLDEVLADLKREQPDLFRPRRAP